MGATLEGTVVKIGPGYVNCLVFGYFTAVVYDRFTNPVEVGSIIRFKLQFYQVTVHNDFILKGSPVTWKYWSFIYLISVLLIIMNLFVLLNFLVTPWDLHSRLNGHTYSFNDCPKKSGNLWGKSFLMQGQYNDNRVSQGIHSKYLWLAQRHLECIT